MTKRVALGLLAVLLATPALAQDEAKKPKNREEAWEIGVRAQGLTADPFMDYFYDEHESVQGFSGGVFLTRHSAGGNRIIIGANYTQTSPKDGIWREAGKDVSANEWTEFESFKVIDAHVVIGKEWSFGPFGFFTGAGFGVAVPSGTITTYPTLPPDYTTATLPGEEKKIPPAVPTVIVRIGPTIHLGPMMTLYADAGVHNGFYAGAGLGLKF